MSAVEPGEAGEANSRRPGRSVQKFGRVDCQHGIRPTDAHILWWCAGSQDFRVPSKT
jgi:hypothetical protein